VCCRIRPLNEEDVVEAAGAEVVEALSEFEVLKQVGVYTKAGGGSVDGHHEEGV
jgi:hypothetical protein